MSDRLKPVEKPALGELVGPLKGAKLSRMLSASGAPLTRAALSE
jgi:hypothetical protein